jgi:hypothetical protein
VTNSNAVGVAKCSVRRTDKYKKQENKKSTPNGI